MWGLRRAGRPTLAATLAAAPFAFAWRFAHYYRERAGHPRRLSPTSDPAALGLPFVALQVPSGELSLPAWWIPARGGEPGPAVLLVHGWESARDRALPEVTAGAILGHSMGAIGALLAAASDPSVAAVVATATPADPARLTRETFRLARLPLPDPIAYPLAWWTARVYLKPRGHRPQDVSATPAAGRYRGPLQIGRAACRERGEMSV